MTFLDKFFSIFANAIFIPTMLMLLGATIWGVIVFAKKIIGEIRG